MWRDNDGTCVRPRSPPVPFTPSCSALLTVPYLTTCYVAQSARHQNSIVWLQTTLSSYRQLQPFDI